MAKKAKKVIRKTRKTPVWPLKSKPLTKAQKAKLTRERNELTKSMRAIDPFYIHPRDVPAGRAYQWVAMEVMGLSNEDAVDRAKEDGWKPVPFARHDFGRKHNSKGRIVIGGMLLMENASSVPTEARKREQDDARNMLAETPIGATKTEGRSFPIVSDSFVVSSAYERVPSDAPAVTVPVTIQFSMNARWQDAAAGLGLSNEEYARRRLLMTMPILAGEPGGWIGGGIYEAVTLRIGDGE